MKTTAGTLCTVLLCTLLVAASGRKSENVASKRWDKADDFGKYAPERFHIGFVAVDGSIDSLFHMYGVLRSATKKWPLASLQFDAFENSITEELGGVDIFCCG